MAGYRALAAVGRSVVDLLSERFAAATPPSVAGVAPSWPSVVLAGTDDFDKVASNPAGKIVVPAVSVYCYRVSVDRETRAGWSAVAHADGVPRVPLRMHLLIAAWGPDVRDELTWLGLVAQVLEGESVLAGPRLHPDGDWRPSDEVHIVPDELALDSMSEAFQALTTDYRLSLPYLARVIRIDGRAVPTAEPVTTVATASGPGVRP